MSRQGFDDWEYCDISGIPEDRFPITCEACDYNLTGLGPAGHCPECNTPFDRRKRLWDLHGPDAFAGTEPTEEQEERLPFSAAWPCVVATAACLPIAAYLSWSGAGINCCAFVFVWFAAVSVVQWAILRRRRPRVPR